MTTNDLLTQANEILTQANPEQVKWVVARLTSKSDKEAAKAVGVHWVTVSKWANKADLDKVVNILLREPVSAALVILQNSAAEAAQVLADGLTSKRSKLRAADSVLDRVGLRGPQEIKHSGDINLTFSGNVDPNEL